MLATQKAGVRGYALPASCNSPTAGRGASSPGRARASTVDVRMAQLVGSEALPRPRIVLRVKRVQHLMRAARCSHQLGRITAET